MVYQNYRKSDKGVFADHAVCLKQKKAKKAKNIEEIDLISFVSGADIIFNVDDLHG